MSAGLQPFFAMQQVVRLLGDLGERYGTEHTYHDLRDPAQAIKLLCINHPRLQSELVEAHKKGIGYRLIQAGVDLSYEDLRLPLGRNDLILTPVIGGSGGSSTKILIGVGLVAASFLLPGAGIFGTVSASGVAAAGTSAATAKLLGATVGGAFATTLGTAISSIGAGLILGGISEMISPQPTLPNISGVGRFDATRTDGPQSATRGASGEQSYAYTGAANTVGLGATIPVAYGEVLVGSHLLSANVEVSDESDPLRDAIKAPGFDTVLFGGEKLTSSFQSASGVLAKRSNKVFTGSNSQQKLKNELVPLVKGHRKELGSVVYIESKREQVEFLFELKEGLFEFVSGTNSTKVDGFITYKVEARGKPQGGSRVVIGSSQATIQGILLNNQVYRWIHRFEISEADYDGNIDYIVEVIDFRLEQPRTFIAHAFGLNLENENVPPPPPNPGSDTVTVGDQPAPTTPGQSFQIDGANISRTNKDYASWQDSEEDDAGDNDERNLPDDVGRLKVLNDRVGDVYRGNGRNVSAGGTFTGGQYDNDNAQFIFDLKGPFFKTRNSAKSEARINLRTKVFYESEDDSETVEKSIVLKGILDKGQSIRLAQTVDIGNIDDIERVEFDMKHTSSDMDQNRFADQTVRLHAVGFNIA